MNLRKILIIALFAFITFGFGFGIYYLFFRPLGRAPEEVAPGARPVARPGLAPAAPGAPRPPERLGAPSGAPSAVARGGLTAASVVVSAPTIGTTISSDGSTLLSYDRSSGKFIRLREDGTAVELSGKTFLNVQNVLWAKDGKRAVIEFPDGSNIVYDFEAEKSVTLPKHWEDFDFSPDGGKIVGKSLGIDAENRWLVTVDADGSNARVLEPLGDNANKVKISWSPNNQVVAFSDTGRELGLSRNEILLIGLNGENFKGLETAGLDFRPLWSPSGRRLLWSTHSGATGYRPQLWTALASGDEIGAGRRSFNLSTWADKCAFADENIIYCAVPKTMPEGIGFQPSLSADTADLIYRLDLETGANQLIAEPEGAYSINKLIVSKNERLLYFTDTGTQAVHRIKLQ
ncbi:hypothetical protein HYT45_00945 [Candidatus Uhrbacteria bacterium]|nr:hypothetical protein [Candidatus Uhrbacteria bacterium]